MVKKVKKGSPIEIVVDNNLFLQLRINTSYN